MIRPIFLAIIFISCINPNNQSKAKHDAAFEMDFIDVYKLTIGSTYIYGKKDDPNATPIVEFTFNKGKLIFIFFANF